MMQWMNKKYKDLLTFNSFLYDLGEDICTAAVNMYWFFKCVFSNKIVQFPVRLLLLVYEVSAEWISGPVFKKTGVSQFMTNSLFLEWLYVMVFYVQCDCWLSLFFMMVIAQYMIVIELVYQSRVSPWRYEGILLLACEVSAEWISGPVFKKTGASQFMTNSLFLEWLYVMVFYVQCDCWLSLFFMMVIAQYTIIIELVYQSRVSPWRYEGSKSAEKVKLQAQRNRGCHVYMIIYQMDARVDIRSNATHKLEDDDNVIMPFMSLVMMNKALSCIWSYIDMYSWIDDI